MLVALHGFTEIDLSWREVFADSPTTVTAPLLPGHGWAPCSDNTTIANVAADIAPRLGKKGSDLLGYSMGGRIALQLALDYPQLVHRLVLISCRPGIADPAARQARLERDERLAEILEDDGIGPFVAWWERQPVLRTVTAPAPLAEQILRGRRLNQNPLGLAAALRRLGQGSMEPAWDRLAELKMPVLLLAGAGDPAYVNDMQRMAEHIPHAEIDIIPAAGHALHREHPKDLVARIDAFLAS